MAKTMARIENGSVVNLEYWADGEQATEGLRETQDRPVGIGDRFQEGRFFRKQEEILTPMEDAWKKIADLMADKASLTAAMASNNTEE